MIEEKFVTLEVAKLLKDKGFNETSLAYWKNGKLIVIYEDNKDILPATNSLIDKLLPNDICYAAPTQQTASNWLRLKKNYNVQVMLDSYVEGCKPNGYYIVINRYGDKFQEVSPTLIDNPEKVFFEKQEDALEEGIKYVLQVLV